MLLLFRIKTPFPVSPKGEKLIGLLPPWRKAGMGVRRRVKSKYYESNLEAGNKRF